MHHLDSVFPQVLWDVTHVGRKTSLRLSHCHIFNVTVTE